MIDKQLERFQITELDYIYKMVVAIVTETNEKLRFCNMDFSEDELEYGVMDTEILTLDEIAKDIN